MNRIYLFLILCALLHSCRADLGTPDYSSFAGITDSGVAPSSEDLDSLPGPFPFTPGASRLSFGIFYEGQYSELIEVDDQTRHYYIFETETNPRVITYEQSETSDRIEGKTAHVLELTGTPWWGGGIIWDEPEDLSQWTTLILALKSDAEGISDIDISVQYEFGNSMPPVVKDAKLQASAYGYVNDGEWHVLEIPMTDFSDGGADLSRVRAPLIFAREGGIASEKLVVDSVFLK